MTPAEPALPSLLQDRNAYRQRLEKILAREITGSPATDNPGAATAAFVMMYVGAINGVNPIRPFHFVRMSDGIAARRSGADRVAFYRAASRSGAAVDKLCAEWKVSTIGWYAGNSREGPRDETFKRWAENGALLVDPSVKTTASVPRYSLTASFARLLDPALHGTALDEAISEWQAENLSPIGRARALARSSRAKAGSAVRVNLPGGASRSLLPGESSEILAAFIHHSALLIAEPSVLFISQSGEPVNVVDHALLTSLGLNLDALRLLPDALIVDVAPGAGALWFVEVVNTDGPIDESRRATLDAWAGASGVPSTQCRFLTAFASRTAAPAKRCLPRLAINSYAWFKDEPRSILLWTDLDVGS